MRFLGSTRKNKHFEKVQKEMLDLPLIKHVRNLWKLNQYGTVSVRIDTNE